MFHTNMLLFQFTRSSRRNGHFGFVYNLKDSQYTSNTLIKFDNGKSNHFDFTANLKNYEKIKNLKIFNNEIQQPSTKTTVL